MEYNAKINKSNILYVKDEVKKIIGEDINILTFTNCVILKNKNIDYKLLLKNLKVITHELKLKIENGNGFNE